jgi:putative transposase
MMQECGVSVDHFSINRWAIRFLPLLEKVFRQHKRSVVVSWRLDETFIKVKGDWKYLYRAVDKQGKTVDFLLTAQRDKAAAMRFFDKAMKISGVPEKVTMDKSGAKVRPWMRSMPEAKRPSPCGKSNILTTSSSRTTGQ